MIPDFAILYRSDYLIVKANPGKYQIFG